MISHQVLRRYPFFGLLNEAQLIEIAKLADEVTIEKSTTMFEEGKKADALYILVEGSVDLYYKLDKDVEHSVGEINPGEPFSISSLIEPYTLTATTRTTSDSRVIKIQADRLRTLCDNDDDLAYKLIHQLAKAAINRLNSVRVQLASVLAHH